MRKGLVRLIDMLRDRYILEYPRSNDETAGVHDLLITVPDARAYVRPAGIAVSVADKKLLADPLTLPPQPSVPIEGTPRGSGDGRRSHAIDGSADHGPTSVPVTPPRSCNALPSVFRPPVESWNGRDQGKEFFRKGGSADVSRASFSSADVLGGAWLRAAAAV